MPHPDTLFDPRGGAQSPDLCENCGAPCDRPDRELCLACRRTEGETDDLDEGTDL